jgi:hypothetical protein
MKQIKGHSELLQGVAVGIFIGAGITIIVFAIVFF